MNTFEITVQRRTAGGWPVVAEQTASGAFLRVRTEGLLQADLEELNAQLLSQPSARDYGTLLGRALFRDHIRAAFVQALPKGDDRLHVLLFVEDADLKGLRWERLCAPLGGGWDFLALHQRVPYSLYLPSTTDQRFPPIGRRDLRALVLVANPQGLEKYRLAPFDAAAAVAGVRASLGGIPADVLAAVPGAVGPATLDALCERITAERYTLLHVVAHGQFKPADGETLLYLANADNQVKPVPGACLLGRLKQLRGARGLPHFAFLSACESAVAEAGPALGGLAQRLVGELGMPAVLAMTEKVSVATAQALTEAFYRRLGETGEPDRALVEACAGLAGRYDVNVPALYSRLGGRPLFSDTTDRPLTVAEIEYGLGRARELLQQRAPVWLAPHPPKPRPLFDQREADLRATLHDEYATLGDQGQANRTRALDEVNSLCDEALERSFAALALGKEPPPYDGDCPFRGLLYFGAENRKFFFGREGLVARLEERLAEHRFLAVLGPSGSGKSSVVLAGLVPALQAKVPHFDMAYLTPGSDPLTFLETSLGLSPRCVLLVVDQFEELFTLCADEAKRRAFLGRLLRLPGELSVVLTMRADFWGECAPYRELKELMQAHQELVAPMDPAELRRAIEMQAAQVGLRFEAGLSNTILDDVQGEPGAMPLLQHALLELWKRRHGRWLRADQYRALGGVKGAIAGTAEEVYRDLSPDDQGRVRASFLRLTRLGEAAPDTRQRVGLSELAPAGGSLPETRALVKRLADSRLLVTAVNPVTGGEVVEVAHEALIQHWPRLRRWLDEDRADVLLLERVRGQAQDWEAEGRAEGALLLRGSRLDDAERLCGHARVSLNDLERQYVEACRDLRRRAQAEADRRQQERAETLRRQAANLRRLRRLVVVIAVLALAAAGAGAYATIKRAEADHATYQARLKSVGFALNSRDITGLRAELPRLEELLGRGNQNAFAWGYLRKLCRDEDRVWADLPGEVRAVRFLDSGKEVAWATENHDFCRLDRVGTDASARPVSPVAFGRNGSVYSLSLSPDGRTLATGNQRGEVTLWSTDTRERQRVLTENWETLGACLMQSNPIGLCAFLKKPPLIRAVAFSPDGRTLASGSTHGSVLLWDVQTGASRRLPGRTGAVLSLAFSCDASLLASGSMSLARDGSSRTGGPDSGEVRLWEVGTAREVRGSAARTHNGGVTSLTFSGDGTALASGDEFGEVKVWTGAARDTCLLVTRPHRREVSCLASSPSDCAVLASGGGDGTVVVWDWDFNGRSGDATFQGHQDAVRALAFSPDGKQLASGGRDRSVRLWDATRRYRSVGHKSGGMSLAFSPDGAQVALGGEGNRVLLVSATDGQRTDLGGHQKEVTCVAFAPSGGAVASASFDGSVRVWRPGRGAGPHPQAPEITWDPDVGMIWYLAFFGDPPGTLLACGARTVKLKDIASGCEWTLFPAYEKAVSAWAVSGDGATLVLGHKDGTVALWDTSSGAKLEKQPQGLAGTGKITAVALMPAAKGGLTLAAGQENGTIFLWERADRGGACTPLLGHTRSINSLDFSPDGRTLASGSDDGSVRLWDVGQQMLQLSLQGETAQSVSRVRFSPDGTLLASRSRDGVVTFWPAEQGKEPLAAGTWWPLVLAGIGALLAVAVVLWLSRSRRRRQEFPPGRE
jgi:WD40 repeat protein